MGPILKPFKPKRHQERCSNLKVFGQSLRRTELLTLILVVKNADKLRSPCFSACVLPERRALPFPSYPKAGERGHEVKSPETAAAACGSRLGHREPGAGQNPGFCGRWSCLGQIKEQNSHTCSGGTTGLQMCTLRYRSILYRINDTAGPCARQCQHHNPCSSMLPDLLLRANLVLQTV